MATRTFNDAATVPAEWQPGDVILDLYEVKEIHTSGGMGLVYRVHHRGWNVDLAVKSPRANFFQTEQQKENFTRECETWINLGLHPHIVSCYYVRTLGGVPRVFAEYVEGGSLKDWIDSKKLYEGREREALKGILDIAIQMAWGLHYAHEQGLIHQDVKPANVLMMPDGTAKVSDFGLAKARAAAGETFVAGGGRSILVSTGGMTPAYCSPEQANKQPLSRRTDLWSWGLSVLEMFAGGIFWRAGQAAAATLENYADEEGAAKMPAGVRELLTRCFQHRPEERPKNLGEAVEALKAIYRESIGSNYFHDEPKPVTLLADALNNRGVSMLDLERKEDAEKFFEAALQNDPHHPEASYNHGLIRWRAAKITDESLVSQFKEVLKTSGQNWRTNYLLGLLHLERGDLEGAVEALEISAKLSKQPEVLATLNLARKHICSFARMVRKFEGHTDHVCSVCLSADGLWALSGSKDHTLRLWELPSGKCAHTFEGHTSDVNSVCLSADGHWALSGSKDHTLRLWEIISGKCLRIFEGHTSGVNSVCMSEDNSWALSGSNDRTLRLWDTTSGRCLRVFAGHAAPIVSVHMSADERWVLSGSGDKTLRLWDVSTGQCIRTLDDSETLFPTSCLSTDGRWALSGGGKVLRLWDVTTGRCVRTFEGHKMWVFSVQFSANGRWALSGGCDKTLRLWEVSTGRCVRTFDGHNAFIQSVGFSVDGRWVVAGSWDKTLRLWSTAVDLTRQQQQESPAQLAVVQSTELTVELASQFATLRTKADAALCNKQYEDACRMLRKAREIPGFERNASALEGWNVLRHVYAEQGLRTAWCVRIMEGHTSRIYATYLGKTGQLVLSGSSDNTLRLWEVTTGFCVRTFLGHISTINAVSLSADGRWAVSGGEDKTLRLWDVATGHGVRILEGHTGGISSVCFSTDGRWVLSGSWDKTLRLWEVASGRCIKAFEGHSLVVFSVGLSTDGCWALSASEDKTLRLWEIATGRCARIFQGHTDWVMSVSFSTDGRWALSGGRDKTLRLWDVSTGACMRNFEGHGSLVKSVSLSIDKRWALSASWDKTVRLWEVSSGRCVRVLEGHTDAVNSVCLSSNNRWVISGSSDKTLRLWELDWDFEVRDPQNWDKGA